VVYLVPCAGSDPMQHRDFLPINSLVGYPPGRERAPFRGSGPGSGGPTELEGRTAGETSPDARVVGVQN
jgi:hypothetical protein